MQRLERDAETEIVAVDDALRTSLEANRAAGVLVSASQTTYDAAFAAYKERYGNAGPRRSKPSVGC